MSLIPQPKPKAEGEVVYDWLRSQWEMINVPKGMLDLLKQRYEQGLEKYGQPLMTKDGRDTKSDLLQEIMDSIIYSAKGIMEGDKKMEPLHISACAFLKQFCDIYLRERNEQTN